MISPTGLWSTQDRCHYVYSPRLPKRFPTVSETVATNRPIVSAVKGTPGDELDGFVSTTTKKQHQQPRPSSAAPRRPSSASSCRSSQSAGGRSRLLGDTTQGLKTNLQRRQEAINAPRKTLLVNSKVRGATHNTTAHVSNHCTKEPVVFTGTTSCASTSQRAPRPPTQQQQQVQRPQSARPHSARPSTPFASTAARGLVPRAASITSLSASDVGAAKNMDAVVSSYNRRSSYETSAGLHLEHPDELKLTLDRHEYFRSHRLTQSCLPAEPTMRPLDAIEETEKELYRESVTGQNGKVLLMNLDYNTAVTLNEKRKREGKVVVKPVTSVDCNSAEQAVSKLAPGTIDVEHPSFPSTHTYVRYRYPELKFRSPLLKWLMSTVELMDHPFIKALRTKYWTCKIPLDSTVHGDPESDPILVLKKIWAKHADKDVGLGMPYSTDNFELFTIEAVTGEKEHKYSKRFQEKLTTFMMGGRKVVRAIPDDVLAAAMDSKPFIDPNELRTFFEGLSDASHYRMNYDLVFVRLHMMLACGTPLLQPALTRLFLSQVMRKIQVKRSCSAHDFYMALSMLEVFLKKGSTVPASHIHYQSMWHSVYRSGQHMPVPTGTPQKKRNSVIPGPPVASTKVVGRGPVKTLAGMTASAPPLQKIEENRQEARYRDRLRAAKTKKIVVRVTTKPAALSQVVISPDRASTNSSNISSNRGDVNIPPLPKGDLCRILDSDDDSDDGYTHHQQTAEDDEKERDNLAQKELMHLMYGEEVETLLSPNIDDSTTIVGGSADDDGGCMGDISASALQFTNDKAVCPEVAQLIATFRREVDIFSQQLPTESFEVQVEQAWRMFPKGSLLLSYLTSGLESEVRRALAKESATLFHKSTKSDDSDISTSDLTSGSIHR